MSYFEEDHDNYDNRKHYRDDSDKIVADIVDTTNKIMIAVFVIIGIMAVITAACTYHYMRRKKIINAGMVHQYGQGLVTTSQPAYQVLNQVQQQPQFPQQMPPNTTHPHGTYPTGTGAF